MFTSIFTSNDILLCLPIKNSSGFVVNKHSINIKEYKLYFWVSDEILNHRDDPDNANLGFKIT